MSIYNIGYLGIGKYNSCENGIETLSYKRWFGMFERCYSEKLHKRKPTYKDCSVSTEWHNFQNFAKWFEENYVEGYQLDKDILIKGNKIYSPETCCFVPKEINLIITNCKIKRGLCPIGVKKSNNRFMARDRNKSLGTFDTPEEAFKEYKRYKENVIDRVAFKYFKDDLITEKVYSSLANWEININD